ncbi:MAG TPA: phosphoribosyltransferase family protein [Vicinamibacteria bacterium]|nr:phosphoribosyltransferase family protein [Vicinamibacteria bacterium]
MFQDRQDAGRQLGELLKGVVTARGDDLVVLAIPRGGVIVARPVGEALGAPLDVIVPRKLGAPDNAELAIGAVALSGDEEITVLDEESLAWLRVPAGYVDSEVERQRREIQRREEVYRQGRPPAPLAGRTVVLVDDGVATGLTARAALAAVSRQHPKEAVLAVPVAPPETVREFGRLGLKLLALETPSPFGAVGRFYADFRPVEDDEVLAVLAASRTA